MVYEETGTYEFDPDVADFDLVWWLWSFETYR